MAVTVNIHEAKTHLSQLLKRVLNGEQIIIAKAGRPIAVLAPLTEAPACRRPGHDALEFSPDFDAPLPEFEEL